MNKLHELTIEEPANRSTGPTPRHRLPWSVIVVIVLLLSLGALFVVARGGFASPQRVGVSTVVPQQGAVRSGSVAVQASGWLEPEPFAIYVHSLVDGVIDQLFVLEGETVEEGQVIATIVRKDSEIAVATATAELEAARAALVTAEATRTAAIEDYEELVDRRALADALGARVESIDAEILETQALISASSGDFESLEAEVARKSGLVASGAVAALEIEQLEAKKRAAAASTAALEQRLVTLAARRREAVAQSSGATRHIELLIEERATRDRAEAAVLGARANVDAMQARLDRAQLDLDRCTVKAPMDGVVLRRLVSPGSNVRYGDTPHSGHVVHLYDPSALQVRTDVPIADAAKVEIGQRAEVRSDVLPDQVFDARVARITHEADIQKNTVEVKVTVDNPTGALKPEMLSKVQFLENASEAPVESERLVVLRRAIDGGQGSPRVFVVVESEPGVGTIDVRSVDVDSNALSRATTEWIEVRSGLRIGERVVTDPRGLEAGDRVTWSSNEGGPR